MSSKLLPVGLRRLSTRRATMRLHVAFAVIAMRREVAQELRIGLAGPKQLGRDRIHLPEAVVAEDDVQILIGVDERAGHVVQRDVKLGFLARQFLLSPLLAGDIGHHRDRAARGRPATIDAIASAVWRDVLEALAGRMAQAFHAPRDQHVHVAFAVVAMCRKVAQELRIGLARLKQFGRDRIHLPETVVAENDVQVLIGIDECARHVVERDLQVAVHDGSGLGHALRLIHRAPDQARCSKTVGEPGPSTADRPTPGPASRLATQLSRDIAAHKSLSHARVTAYRKLHRRAGFFGFNLSA